jgi:hypothetical protein
MEKRDPRSVTVVLDRGHRAWLAEQAARRSVERDERSSASAILRELIDRARGDDGGRAA